MKYKIGDILTNGRVEYEVAKHGELPNNYKLYNYRFRAHVWLTEKEIEKQGYKLKGEKIMSKHKYKVGDKFRGNSTNDIYEISELKDEGTYNLYNITSGYSNIASIDYLDGWHTLIKNSDREIKIGDLFVGVNTDEKDVQDFHSEVEEILSQREETHGEFVDVAKSSQLLKNTLRYSGFYAFRSDIQKEALEMICVKIARLVSSQQIHRDNVVDIIGYATLMLKDIDDNNLKGE